jgi:DNA polymerase elongation subunit (family B)
VARNLRKEIHPGTKPSIDFIKKILDDAYNSGMAYDLTDMRSPIMAFALNSTNQSHNCLKIVQTMKFKSENGGDNEVLEQSAGIDAFHKEEDTRLAFFDVEVYPNLFVVCWKYDGDAEIVKMINPSREEVAALFKLRLVGYNCRRYDNHILYAASMGYNNKELFELSQKLIVEKNRNAYFGNAYGLSYTDIFDYASVKQSLKMWQVELGLPHKELDIPWDQDVPEEMWDIVVDYCCNDVLSTEATHHARKQDFVARQVLAEISGLSVNDTTQRHAAKIIFGNDKNPQASFHYTHLEEEFPGYEFENGKSTYRGEDPSEGGYVYAEPGIYENVPVLDVASMHPTSIVRLNLFGEYTKNFLALIEARLAIKRRDFDAARAMFNGRLAPFLEDTAEADALSYALKIAINIVYGLTSARFDNPFKDNRNRDNIVAKRGALFMIDLKHAAQEKGLTVAHIKTDSIKLPGATQEDIDEVVAFGAKYGYEFEHETTYEKFCLIDKAQYIARENGMWTATGAEFQHPYVFKTLFSQEVVVWEDLCETKQVTQGDIYIDFNHDTPMATEPPVEDRMIFAGRVGKFVPVKEGIGGGILYRVKDGKQYKVTGTSGYLWMEADMALAAGGFDVVDMTYYEGLAEEARKSIEKFGSFEEFVS